MSYLVSGSYCSKALLVVYGCGPNIVVGIAGSLTSAAILTYQKIQLFMAEQELAMLTDVDNSESQERTQLLDNIFSLTHEIERTQKILEICGISIFPFIGPLIASEFIPY